MQRLITSSTNRRPVNFPPISAAREGSGHAHFLSCPDGRNGFWQLPCSPPWFALKSCARHCGDGVIGLDHARHGVPLTMKRKVGPEWGSNDIQFGAHCVRQLSPRAADVQFHAPRPTGLQLQAVAAPALPAAPPPAAALPAAAPPAPDETPQRSPQAALPTGAPQAPAHTPAADPPPAGPRRVYRLPQVAEEELPDVWAAARKLPPAVAVIGERAAS
jgi:hypothetical protein